MVDDETGDRPGDSTDTLVRAQRSGARAVPLAVSASLVLALGAMLAWVGLANRSDSISDVEATEATVGASTTIDSTPRTLTSIPFCDETSTAIAESFTQVERQRAHDALIEAWEAAGEGHALSGVGVEGLHPLVEIDLSDHDEAASFAEQIGLPPPYDIYCINPREVDTGILLP